MSKIELSSITTSSASSPSDFYVATVIYTDSGYVSPRMVFTVSELVTIYGSNFPGYITIESILKNGIPVLITPVITPVSEYCKATLRLTSDPNIKYCYPAIARDYNVSHNTTISKFTIRPSENTSKYTIQHKLNLQYLPATIVKIDKDLNSTLLNSNDYTITYTDKDELGVEFIISVDKDDTYELYLESYDKCEQYISDGVKVYALVPDCYPIVDAYLENRYVPCRSYIIPESKELNVVADPGSTVIIRWVSRGSLKIKSSSGDISNIQLPSNYVPKLYFIDSEDSTFITPSISFNEIEDISGSVITVKELPGSRQIDIIYNNYDLLSSNSTASELSMGSNTYSLILDFSKLAQGDEDQLKLNLDTLCKGHFRLKLNNLIYLFNTNWSGVKYGLEDQDSVLTINADDTSTIQSLVNDHINNINSINGVKVYSTCGRFIEYFEEYFTKNDYDHELFDEYLNKLTTYLAVRDYPTTYKLSAINIITTAFIESYDEIPYEGKTEDDYKIYKESLHDLTKIKIINLCKDLGLHLIFNIETSSETSLFLTTSSDDLDITIDYDKYSSLDRLCSMTESNKTIEFYSKYKGGLGEEISITIEKVMNAEYKYRISVSTDLIKESYMVDTSGNVPDYGSGYMLVKDIQYNSRLISARLFDYRLADGRLCSKHEFDKKSAIDEEYKVENEIHNTELITGSWSLGRSYVDYYTYDYYLSTTRKLFSDYDYHPDFLLIGDFNTIAGIDPDLVREDVDIYQHFTSHIQMICEQYHTQAFFNIDKSIMSPVRISSLYNKDGRILYFYGYLNLGSNKLYCYYPYLINFIKSKFLKRITDNISYKLSDTVNGITIDADYLKMYGINFITTNNLGYRYDTIREVNPNPDKHPIIVFMTSKLSRLFMERSENLIGCENSELQMAILDVINKTKELLPMISSLDYDYQVDGNIVTIYTTMMISKLTNRSFKFNITLNI